MLFDENVFLDTFSLDEFALKLHLFGCYSYLWCSECVILSHRLKVVIEWIL